MSTHCKKNKQTTKLAMIINNCLNGGMVFGIVLLGPANSGKGTQAKMLMERYDGHHVSTGDLVRDKIACDAIFAEKYSGRTGSGALIDDDVVFDLTKECLSSANPAGIIVLDGWCRTKPQVDKLDDLFTRPDHLIAFDFIIPIDVVRTRANVRGREDDRRIDGRFKLWDDHRSIVRSKLKAKGVRVVEVNANQDPVHINSFIEREIIFHGRKVRGLIVNKSPDRRPPVSCS